MDKGSSTEVLKLLYEGVEKSFEEVEAIHMMVIEASGEAEMADDYYMNTLESVKIEVHDILQEKLKRKMKTW